MQDHQPEDPSDDRAPQHSKADRDIESLRSVLERQRPEEQTHREAGAGKRARAEQGVVKLVLRERSRSLFTLTQLEKMLEMFDELEPAIASFAGPDGGYKARF